MHNKILTVFQSQDLLKLFCCVQAEKHHPPLVQMLCGQLGVEPNALLDFELCLADTQPGVSLFVFMLDKYPKDFSFAFYSLSLFEVLHKIVLT